MKNYKIIGLPISGEPVFTPIFGSLQQVTIAHINVCSDMVVAHMITPKGSVSKIYFRPDTPTRAFYRSYESYAEDVTISESYTIIELLKAISGFKGSLTVNNDGNIVASGWLVDGNVVCQYKGAVGETLFSLEDGSYKSKVSPFSIDIYKNKDDAFWNCDIHEVLADGSVVIHEAESKKWQLSERQSQIWDSLKALLAEAEKEKLHIYYERDECELACFSYANFTEIRGVELYESDGAILDGWTAIPHQAIVTESIPDFNEDWRPYLK